MADFLCRVATGHTGLFIGHRYRMQMLDRLITYMKTKPGVWFATHEEAARYVRAQAGMDG